MAPRIKLSNEAILTVVATCLCLLLASYLLRKKKTSAFDDEKAAK